MFLGELHIGISASSGRKLGLDRVKAVQKSFEFAGGNHFDRSERLLPPHFGAASV